jgi:hypothetical protein
MSKLEIEVGDTVEASVGLSKGARGVCIIDCFRGNGTYKISWYDFNASWVDFKDLTLIKKGKTMQFTKSDLNSVHFVKLRDATYWIVLGNVISNNAVFYSLERYLNNLKFSDFGNSDDDIMSVYTVGRKASLNAYLNGEALTKIWERTEQTPAQKEMEVLQEQAKALQEQITKLQGKL